MKHKRFLFRCVLVGGMIAVALGVSLLLWLKHGTIVTISEDELRSAIRQQFPMQKTHLLILQVTYSDPVIELLDNRERIRIGLTATPDVTLNGERYSGSAVVQGGFRYEPQTGEFFLTGFSVESIQLEGRKGISLERVSSALSDALEGVFRRYPVYTLRDEDFKQATAKMLVRRISISDKKIHIHLGLP